MGRGGCARSAGASRLFCFFDRLIGLFVFGNFMETSRSTSSHNVPSIIVGVVAVITATLGILYSASTIFSVTQGSAAALVDQRDWPYFYQAFFIMSAICIACYLILIVCGINLVRSRLGSSRLVTLVLLLEVGYLFAIGTLWMEPTFGHSIAAATGVANGGMMIQMIILLPLWGPLLLWRANKLASLTHTAELSA